MIPDHGGRQVTAPIDDRFAFGENWASFLRVVDARRIGRAESALADLLGTSSLSSRTFLDVGSGSGLSSVAACRLGARVRAFDYDAACVACTQELLTRWAGEGAEWRVEQGSVLDEARLRSLGTFDVVHAWGVLHHTGEMWRALANTVPLVAPGGMLVVALYNEQGWQTSVWRAIKRTYIALPEWLRPAWVTLVMVPLEAKALLAATVRGRLREYVRRFSQHSTERGMSLWHDWRDWVGGWPFEAATPAEVTAFCRERGLELKTFRGSGGHGCNEFVFERPLTLPP